MSAELKADFTKVILESAELPRWARNCVGSARGVEAKVLERSYLDFLDDMIAREHRGPEWTEVLKRRRNALSSYCGKLLVSGFVDRFSEQLFVKIDPVTQRILYWEIWPADGDMAVGGGEVTK